MDQEFTEPGPKPLHGRSQEIYDALRDAGIIHPDDRVRRVIIDIQAGAAVTLYIERYADTRTLELLPALADAEIRWAAEPPAPGTGEG